MQHSAHTGSGRRQDRVPLAVDIDLRGTESAASTILGPDGQPADHEELRSIAADGLNVSIGGIAMRAAVAPPLGMLLECSFECPPTGDLVCAQGEVVWSEQSGPTEGQFGLRFVELDTKSATALRRLVAPTELHEVKPERTRATTLVIDGLATTVEAELKLSDDKRIVLEQQLSFLQLGRGVEVSLPGRGKERGRIASVELRHTHFDVPTLVFGVLLDESPERVQVERFEAAANKLAPLFSAPATLDEPAELPVSAQVSARMRERISALRRERAVEARVPSEPSAEQASERVSWTPKLRDEQLPEEMRFVLLTDAQRDRELEASGQLDNTPEGRLSDVAGESTKKVHVALTGELLIHAQPHLPSSAAESAPAMCVEDAEVEPQHAEELEEREPVQADAGEHDEGDELEARAGDEPEEEDEAEEVEEPHAAAHARPASASDSGLSSLSVRNLPTHLRSLFRAPVARFQDLRQRIEPTLREQAEYFDLPDAKTRFLLQLARVRMLLLQSWSKVQRSTQKAGPRAPRALRVQRSTLLGLGPAELERPEPSRRARSVAIAFAVLGVGLGVYALAPRSGADRIKLPERVQAEVASPEPVLADEELELIDEPAPVEVAPRRKGKAARLVAQEAAPDVGHEAAGPMVTAPFGELEVPNGRVFSLRMNGPVQVVEGEARENGITVRVPGRQALDRASPIATSHSAVQRAMILNRGGFAELTIDFAPGMSPKYQVRGKDNTLEVTLERL